jgi:hypothetical protein
MPLNLSGAYLVGYNQTNNFFGDSLFRRGSTATMTVSAIIDVRPKQAYPSSPTANSDHIGAKEAFDFINSQVSSIGDWQEIKIDYGLGETVVATGRIGSLNSVRPNPVRIGEFNIDIEIPVSGSHDAWNMDGPTHQDEFINEFPGTKIKNLFQSSGAVFQDFSEQFNFTLGEDGSYEYDHSLNMQMLSGSHLTPDPVQTAKEVAEAIFFVAPSDSAAFGFIDNQFSGFYQKTVEATIDAVNKSGVKYYSESYDLENFNCSFSKKAKLDGSLKENYSLDISHSMTMGADGYVNISENGLVRSTANKPIAERYAIVTGAMETEIGAAKARCDSFYDVYRLSGIVNPDYKFSEGAATDRDSDTLFAKAISLGRSYQPNLSEASYSIAFTNNKHTYETDGIHEFTQNVSEQQDGIVSVSVDGTFQKYYPNKPPTPTASDYNWITSIYNTIKGGLLTKAQQTYSYYKTQQNRTFQERAKTASPVTRYNGDLVDPSIALVKSNVTIPKYGPSIQYSNEYTDDPSILKSGPLYDLGFRKFSVSTNDKMMKPINSAYVIAGNKYQVLHDATQTEMGSRSFSIEAFIKRPSGANSNTITNPTVWNIGPKLDAIKGEIKQIMANIVADAKLKSSDTFIQDVSFTIDSKGNFSSSGNIPFIALGGEKYNTVGRII